MLKSSMGFQPIVFGMVNATRISIEPKFGFLTTAAELAGPLCDNFVTCTNSGRGFTGACLINPNIPRDSPRTS